MKKAGLLLMLALVVGCNEEAIRQPPPAAPPAPETPVPAPAAANPAEALKNALTVDPVDAIAPDGRVVVRAHLKNPTAKELRPVLSWEAQGTWWQGEKATMSPVPPGGEGTIEVHAKIGERVFPLPRARLEVMDGKQKLCGWEFLDRAMAAVGPLVREWNVIGPFELGLAGPTGNEKEEKEKYLKERLPGWDGVLPAEEVLIRIPEYDFSLRAAYVAKGGDNCIWFAAKADEKGFVDFGAIFRGDVRGNYSVVLAAAYIYCEKAGRYSFTCGSTDNILVRVNSKEVWRKRVIRSAAADQDAFSADLKEGWNEVLVKVAHRDGPWGFYFRIVDPQRQLKFALKPAAVPAKP